MHSMTHEQPCTDDDLLRIRRAALERINYLLWLATALERTADRAIRVAAAQELRQLFGGAR